MGSRRGFSLIEMIVVMLLLGVVAAFAIPRSLKRSPQAQVDSAARALARDIELVRMRAIAAKRVVRVSFVVEEEAYTAYLDLSAERAGGIMGTEDEVRASRLLTRGSAGDVPGVELPRSVVFGTGSAASGPDGFATGDPVSLVGDQVQFDAGGMITPEGSGGVIYVMHEDAPTAVAAITISGAGAVRAWRYRDGSWIQ